MLYSLRRNILALTLGALCVKSMRGDRRNRRNGRLSPPRTDRSLSRSSTFSDDTSAMSLSGSEYLPVSELYYSHGENPRSPVGVPPDQVSVQFQDGRTPEGAVPTIYDTVFALLRGNSQMPNGMLQRLLKDELNVHTVRQEELRLALEETMRAFKEVAKWDCALEVVKLGGRVYSNNNRSLYVLQTIKRLFPKTQLLVRCREIARMSSCHGITEARECDDMTVTFPPGFQKHPSYKKNLQMFRNGKLSREFSEKMLEEYEDTRKFFFSRQKRRKKRKGASRDGGW